MKINIPKNIFDVTEKVLKEMGKEIPPRPVLEEAVQNVIKIKVDQLLDEWGEELRKGLTASVIEEVAKLQEEQCSMWTQLSFLYM